MKNEFIFNKCLLNKLGLGSYELDSSSNNIENSLNLIRIAYKDYKIRLFDTAEMYGDGKAECIIGDALEMFDRSTYFLIGKVLPESVKSKSIRESCINSLNRLKTSYFDVYLLHWKDDVDLNYFINEMENLKADGLIKEWGVSNFDVKEMIELFALPNGKNCFMNQCLYNITERGVEFDLIPWCKENNVLFMGYSPLCNSYNRRKKLYKNDTLIYLSNKYNVSIETILLAFVNQNKDTISVFKTSSLSHLENNLQSLNICFSDDDLDKINSSFPKPIKKVPLHKI